MGMIAEMFREGGWWMYMVLAIGLMVYPVLLVSAVLYGSSFRQGAPRRRRRLIAGAMPLVGAIALVAVGVVGWQMGLAEAQAALEMATPEVRDRLWARGQEVAAHPLRAAGVLAILPGLAGMIFLVSGLLTKDDGPD